MAEMLDHMKTLSMPNFKRNFSEIRFSNFNGLKSRGWPGEDGTFENEFMSKGETFFHSSSSIVVIMKEIHLRTKWTNQRNILQLLEPHTRARFNQPKSLEKIKKMSWKWRQNEWKQTAKGIIFELGGEPKRSLIISMDLLLIFCYYWGFPSTNV